MNRRRHGGWIGLLSRAVIAALLLIGASVAVALEPASGWHTDGR